MIRLILAAVLLYLPAFAQKKPVTLEALDKMRSPEAVAAPVWAPDGKRFAAKSGSKIMVYDVEAKSEKEAASLDELRSQAVEPIRPKAMDWENRRVSERIVQWAPSSKSLLISHQGELFLWTDGQGVQQLTRTAAAERDPKLSPDASKISFRIDYDLYVMDLSSKKVTRLTSDGSASLWNGMLDWVYPEELDLGTAHWWSPDSKSVAYLQFDVSRQTFYPHIDHLPIDPVAEPQRYPKAGTPNADVRVGVVNAAGGHTKWLDFGETRDHLTARVAWSPNSREVTIHRMNRVQNKLEILSADVESNQARTLVKEVDPAWINISDDFRYLSNGEFLLTSERDGFRHIYLYEGSGKLKHQITKGDWEVSDIACLDEAKRLVYFTSTEKSPLERHLYVAGLNGKGKKRLTQEEGTHTVSISENCEWYLDSFSSFGSPTRRTLHRAESGDLWGVYREANTESTKDYDLLPSEIHTFKGDDGALFYARLIKPKGFVTSKKYPAIVMVYGGPHAQTVRNSFSGLSWDQVLAHSGFVIWQMDNRGSAGRGHQWEAKLYRRFGAQELADQKQGVKYLLSLGFVDDKRIGIYGWSYGGFMTLYSLLHAPEVFSAGVAGAAVTDWRNYDTIYTERYLGLPQDNEEGYRLSSPVPAAENLKGKLLLIHNIGDDNVLFANALQMTNALQLAQKPFDLQIYPQKTHGVTGKARNHMLRTATDFFIEALKP